MNGAKRSTKAALGAGLLITVGVLTLAFSPGAGRQPLGTTLVLMGIIFASSAVRDRIAGI